MISLVNANSINMPLADQSVDMMACSPPYYNLRDYKTGEYVGGDPVCEHRHGNQAPDNMHPDAIQAGVRPGSDFSTCILCGATRVDQQIGIESIHDCKAWAMGMEPCQECYVCAMRTVGMETWRVLKDTGLWFLNLGDSYNGYPGNVTRGGAVDGKTMKARQMKPTGYGLAEKSLKPGDLMGIPWLCAFALQADGWVLRSDIIWHKSPSCKPESVKTRVTRSHEHVFMLAKGRGYYFDYEVIMEPSVTEPDKMRRKRDVWNINPQPYAGAHYACWPPALVRPMILAGCPPGGLVLDPFAGSGTTGLVARELGRKFIGLDLSFDYLHDQAMVRLGLAERRAWERGQGVMGKGADFSNLPLFEQGDKE